MSDEDSEKVSLYAYGILDLYTLVLYSGIIVFVTFHAKTGLVRPW